MIDARAIMMRDRLSNAMRPSNVNVNSSVETHNDDDDDDDGSNDNNYDNDDVYNDDDGGNHDDNDYEHLSSKPFSILPDDDLDDNDNGDNRDDYDDEHRTSPDVVFRDEHSDAEHPTIATHPESFSFTPSGWCYMGDGNDLPLVGPSCNTPTPQQNSWEQFEPADGVQPGFPMVADDDSNHEVGEQPTFLQTFPDARPPLLASPPSCSSYE
jgi:hypothetical protein